VDKRVGMQGRGEGSDWLGSYTGPHTKEVCTGRYARLATRISSLMEKITHLCRVYQIVACHSLFWEGNYERDRKGTS
jgi:hypothetical protein